MSYVFFKPKILEKAAEHIKDDELTRSALLNIVSEELRTNGLTNTPEQSQRFKSYCWLVKRELDREEYD